MLKVKTNITLPSFDFNGRFSIVSNLKLKCFESKSKVTWTKHSRVTKTHVLFYHDLQNRLVPHDLSSDRMFVHDHLKKIMSYEDAWQNIILRSDLVTLHWHFPIIQNLTNYFLLYSTQECYSFKHSLWMWYFSGYDMTYHTCSFKGRSRVFLFEKTFFGRTCTFYQESFFWFYIKIARETKQTLILCVCR